MKKLMILLMFLATGINYALAQKKTLTDGSETARLYCQLGNILVDKDQDKALIYFDSALAINPAMAEAYKGKAIVFYQRHDYTGALRICNTGINIDPNVADLYFYRASCNFRLDSSGNAEKIVEDLNAAAQLGKLDTMGYYYRGKAAYFIDDLNQTVEDMTALIRMKPSFEIYFTRALAYYYLFDRQASLADFESCATFEPRNPNIFRGRALNYLAMNQYDKSIANIEIMKALALNPNAEIPGVPSVKSGAVTKTTQTAEEEVVKPKAKKCFLGIFCKKDKTAKKKKAKAQAQNPSVDADAAKNAGLKVSKAKKGTAPNPPKSLDDVPLEKK